MDCTFKGQGGGGAIFLQELEFCSPIDCCLLAEGGGADEWNRYYYHDIHDDVTGIYKRAGSFKSWSQTRDVNLLSDL